MCIHSASTIPYLSSNDVYIGVTEVTLTTIGEEDRTKFIALGVLAGLVVLGCVVQGVVAGVIKVCLLCKNKQREHKIGMCSQHNQHCDIYTDISQSLTIDHNGSSRDHSSTITLKKVK